MRSFFLWLKGSLLRNMTYLAFLNSVMIKQFGMGITLYLESEFWEIILTFYNNWIVRFIYFKIAFFN